MKKLSIAVLLVLFLSGVKTLVAQEQKSDTASFPYWIEMMQNPESNFYDVQRAFNTYWKDRKITRGSGWKPFKRWESRMQMRITPDGKMPSASAVKDAYEQFMSNYDNSTSLSGNWVSQGPADLPSKGYEGLGRVNTIAFHPTNPDIIYIGAPAGGFWYTTSGGNLWTTTTDHLPTLGVSAIAVDPLNPSTIYIGTGDRDADDAPGMGVYKSTDGGNTWLSSNIGMGNVIVGCMLIHPTNPQILLAGTSAGVFKSIDGGATWQNKSGGFFKDLAFKPGNNNVIYGTYSGIFVRSTDQGETWTQISNGIPSNARLVIGVTPAAPEFVYVMAAKSDNGFMGLYKSINGGEQFVEMSSGPNILDWSCDGSGSGGQAWYDLALTVDHTDPNTIYAGGVNIWKSTNGGSDWNINAHWYGGCTVPAVHADQHFFKVNPLNGKIYAANDGGVYWTSNGGTVWHEISTGLVISQAYKIGQSATVDDMVINGYQDNGTSVLIDDTWTAVNGGDGMECAIDYQDEAYKYATVYYGSINRINGLYNQGQIAGNGVNGITEEGAWVTPFVLGENDPATMFIGYKNVWRSFNVKASSTGQVKWKKISTINTGNLSVLEHSPVNTQILFAASSNSLYLSTNVLDENPTWATLTNRLPSTSTISDIETSPFEENTVYIAQDKKIYKSTDLGINWTDITANFPDIHINSITYYKNSQEGLYLGTDAGVYYKDKSMTDWIPFNNGLPASVSVRELEIYYDPNTPEGDRIKAGTYGRGLWKSDMYYANPTADFSASPLVIPAGCSVNFKDLSLGVPFSWNWTFAGATPTSSNEQNPTDISYSTPGTFAVTLNVTNTAGTNSLTKLAYITVSDTIKPLPGFYASQQAYCNLSDVIKFTDTTKYCPIAWNWTFSPNTVTFKNGTSANSQNPEVTFNQSGSYNVTLNVANGNGSRQLAKTSYIMAGGFITPFVEDFESNSLNSKGWTVENPDNEVTWALTEVNGSSPGNKAAWMNFFNYPAPAGRRDRLVSPVLNFTGVNPVFMSFEHAYASRYSTFSDSLIIYISDNCGSSWKRILSLGEKGQGTFATVPKQTTFFAPSGYEEWCGGTWGSLCNTVDLTEYANKANIQIAFETFNKYGNNLYLDNIIISGTTDLNQSNTAPATIEVFPNPANQMVTVRSNTRNEDVLLSLVNQLGIKVFEKKISAGDRIQETIDIQNLTKGVYIIQLKGVTQTQREKLIIQ